MRIEGAVDQLDDAFLAIDGCWRRVSYIDVDKLIVGPADRSPYWLKENWDPDRCWACFLDRPHSERFHEERARDPGHIPPDLLPLISSARVVTHTAAPS